MHFHDYLVYVIVLPIIILDLLLENQLLVEIKIIQDYLNYHHELLNNLPIISLFLSSSNFECSSYFILIIVIHMCVGVTKGPSVGIFIHKKTCFYEAVQKLYRTNFLCEFAYKYSLLCIHWLIQCISRNIHNYKPNQANSVAKSCFYCAFSLKNTTWMRRSRDLHFDTEL